MAVTQNSYEGDGSTTNYSFTFPYLKKSEIKASLDATVTTAFTTPTATTVQFNTAPASGVKIKIYRETDSDSLTATFYAGSAIKSEDLNDNFTQNLYATQEINARYLSNLGGNMTGDLQLGEDVAIKFEGATDNNFETTLTVADPTADRTITLPNITGTVITSADTDTVTSTMVDASLVNANLAANADISLSKLENVDSAKIIVGNGSNVPTAVAVTGDIGIDNAGLTSITAGSIINADVKSDAAIEFTKLENLDSAKILVGNGSNKAAEVSVSGDVTIANDGAVTIANDAVDIDKLASNSVVNASVKSDAAIEFTKLENLDSTKILVGNASNKATEVAVSGDVTISNTGVTTIGNNKVGPDELANTAVTAASYTAADITVDDQGRITAASNGTIGTTEIANDAITADKINNQEVTTAKLADEELRTLAGMQSGTASILADTTALTATTAELNILDNKSFRASGDGALSTTSDTEIPSSKVIANHVAAQLGTVGGFTTIATEVAFPATASQPAAGVIISISDAAGIVVSGSSPYSSTTGRTVDGTPATVTINNFPSSLAGETLASGVGLLVTSTGSGNTYTYHKILAAENDVKQLSDDINDFNARYRVAGSAPGSNNDAGDMYFDTSANKMKVYNGTTSTWDDVASVGNFYINTISGSSGTGGNSSGNFDNNAYRFQLSNAPTSAQQLIVSVNGVIQKPNAGSSQPSEGFAISGNDIIFSAAPASGADYFIVTQGSSVSIGTPSDNTVATAKIQNLAVTNAKIANDTIAEGKLDVHNAPATGKYLKYTSNGMEWSDGASEGTDVKSTSNGNEAVTKFLRADGDGTCSWQVPPDTTYSVQDGQLSQNNFTDALKTKLDGIAGSANNYAISADLLDQDNMSSNSSTKVPSQQSVKAYVDTQVGAISAAPEVTGTASGSIAANAGVQVNSDGTFSQPAAVSEANGSETSTSSSYPAQNSWGQAYDSDAGKVIQFYHRPYSSNTSHDNAGLIRVGTVSGTSISWGSHLSFGTTHCEETKIIFHPPTGKVVATWAQGSPATGGTSSGTVYWRVGTISGTSVTWGSPVSTGVSTGDYNYARMFWNPDDPTKIGLGYRNNNYIRLRHCTVSTSSNTCTDNGISATIGASGSSEWDILCAEGQMFAAMQSGGSNYTVQVVGLASDYSQNWSYMSTPSSGQRLGSPRLAYDKANNKLVVMCWKGTNDTTIAYVGSVTSSGNTTAFSWGGEQDIDVGYAGSIGADYCKKAEKYIFFSGGSGNSSLESRTAVVSGTGLSTDSQVTHRSNPGTRQVMAVNARNDDNGGSSSGTYIISAIFGTGSGHDDTIKTVVKQLPSTTRDANKYLGISKAGYTNGQAATVKVVGNTADSSSLTPNTTYYIQDDGTIGSTATDVTVGRAFSTTKILIK